MKNQKYVGYLAFPELILWLLNTLVTYFKKALVNYLNYWVLTTDSWIGISSRISGKM